ncbi:unnamed protein product [Protopolystoma xenopodis]|uniref:Uncharacterized protein n=1 Tax=Protopolystoma xenopodis TaxID=117903 RepID=A0A3S5B1V6_9PLAT|nr:unnamed protein product [Protopolystoma xenopodis]
MLEPSILPTSCSSAFLQASYFMHFGLYARRVSLPYSLGMRESTLSQFQKRRQEAKYPTTQSTRSLPLFVSSRIPFSFTLLFVHLLFASTCGLPLVIRQVNHPNGINCFGRLVLPPLSIPSTPVSACISACECACNLSRSCETRCGEFSLKR